MFHERSNGGFGRGFSCGNGIEVHQVPTGRTQPDRQEEEWSIPTNVGRSEDDTERHEPSRAPPPPAPPPTEDRLFTNWSSVDSPRERTSQRNVSRDTELNTNQTDNQMEQPGSEPARIEAMGNTLSDIRTFPSVCRQPSQVVTRYIDREMNTSDVEVRTQREEMQIENLSSNEVIISNNRDTQMPTSHSGLSSHDTEITGGSPIRT